MQVVARNIRNNSLFDFVREVYFVFCRMFVVRHVQYGYGSTGSRCVDVFPCMLCEIATRWLLLGKLNLESLLLL
jgi:hypothetical protein